MKLKLCPKCGRETKKLVGSLCENCFREMHELIEAPEKIVLEVCKNCGRIRKNKKWLRKDLDEIIMDFLKINGKLKKLKIEKIETKNGFNLEIYAEGVIEGVKFEEKKNIEVKIKERFCDMCGKIRGGYYEAVVQLRSNNKEKVKKLINLIEKIIVERNGFLVRTEKVKNGVDLYVTPKRLLSPIVRSVKGAKEIKRSYTLVTRKDGRNIYRTTLLIRV